MKYFIFIFSIALLSCNSDSNSEIHSDSTSHTTHNTASGGVVENQNHMKSMHDAMNGMMEQMHNMKPTGDADYDFAMMMKHHHQGAIDMAKIQIEGGTDTALKAASQHTINEQEGEIAALNRIMQSSKPSGNSKYGQMAMGMMTSMSNIKMEGGSLDAMFASMMIPHHQDAVRMSEEFLKVGKNEELKRIARSIIQTQPREIQQLQQWLNNNNNK